MLKQFFPFNQVASVFRIDYGQLAALGYRGLIFDIDQTLVNHGDPATPEIEALFADLQRQGFKTMLLSNNDEERILDFTRNIDSPFIALADKPKPHAYHQALERLGLSAEEVIMIGDQVFTDVLGANRAGLASILVTFIRREHEVKLGKRRRLEQLILWFYRHSPYYNRLGQLEKLGGEQA